MTNKKDNELDTTLDEWNAELALNEDVPGYTLTELANEFGLSVRAMGERIKKLLSSQRVISKIGKRTDLRGRPYSVTVYELSKKGKK